MTAISLTPTKKRGRGRGKKTGFSVKYDPWGAIRKRKKKIFRRLLSCGLYRHQLKSREIHPTADSPLHRWATALVLNIVAIVVVGESPSNRRRLPVASEKQNEEDKKRRGKNLLTPNRKFLNRS